MGHIDSLTKEISTALSSFAIGRLCGTDFSSAIYPLLRFALTRFALGCFVQSLVACRRRAIFDAMFALSLLEKDGFIDDEKMYLKTAHPLTQFRIESAMLFFVGNRKDRGGHFGKK